MGTQYKARAIQTQCGTTEAALYLKRRGYSLSAALHILLGAEVRK